MLGIEVPVNEDSAFTHFVREWSERSELFDPARHQDCVRIITPDEFYSQMSQGPCVRRKLLATNLVIRPTNLRDHSDHCGLSDEQVRLEESAEFKKHISSMVNLTGLTQVQGAARMKGPVLAYLQQYQSFCTAETVYTDA